MQLINAVDWNLGNKDGDIDFENTFKLGLVCVNIIFIQIFLAVRS